MIEKLKFPSNILNELKGGNSKTRSTKQRMVFQHHISLIKKSTTMSDFIIIWRLYHPQSLLFELKPIRALPKLKIPLQPKIFSRRHGRAGVKLSHSKSKLNTYNWRLVSFICTIKSRRQPPTLHQMRRRFIKRNKGKDCCNRLPAKDLLIEFGTFHHGYRKVCANGAEHFGQTDGNKTVASNSRVVRSNMNRATHCISEAELSMPTGEQYEEDVLQTSSVEQPSSFPLTPQFCILESNLTEQEYCVFLECGSTDLCCSTEIAPYEEDIKSFNQWQMPVLAPSVWPLRDTCEHVWLCSVQVGPIDCLQEKIDLHELVFPESRCAPPVLVPIQKASTIVSEIPSWRFATGITTQSVDFDQFGILTSVCYLSVTIHFLMLSSLPFICMIAELVRSISDEKETRNVTKSCFVNLNESIQPSLVSKNSKALLQHTSTKSPKHSYSHFLWSRKKRSPQNSRKVGSKLKDLIHHLRRKIYNSLRSQPFLIERHEHSKKCKLDAIQSLQIMKISEDIGFPLQAALTFTTWRTSILKGKKNQQDLECLTRRGERLLSGESNLDHSLPSRFLKTAKQNKTMNGIRDSNAQYRRETKHSDIHFTNNSSKAKGGTVRAQQIIRSSWTSDFDKTTQMEDYIKSSTDNDLEPGEVPSIFELCMLQGETRMKSKKSQVCPEKKVERTKRTNITEIRKYKKQHEDICGKYQETAHRITKGNVHRKLLNSNLPSKIQTMNSRTQKVEDHLSQNQNNISLYDTEIIGKQTYAQHSSSSSRTIKPLVRGCSACCIRTRRYAEHNSTGPQSTKPQLITLEEAENKCLFTSPPPECGDSRCAVYPNLADQRYRSRRGKFVRDAVNRSTPNKNYRVALDRLRLTESNSTVSDTTTISVDEFKSLTPMVEQRTAKWYTCTGMQRLVRTIKRKPVAVSSESKTSTIRWSSLGRDPIPTLLSLAKSHGQ